MPKKKRIKVKAEWKSNKKQIVDVVCDTGMVLTLLKEAKIKPRKKEKLGETQVPRTELAEEPKKSKEKKNKIKD